MPRILISFSSFARNRMACWVIIMCFAAWLQSVSSHSNSLAYDLQLQLKSICPLSISPNPPLQATGSYLEKCLASKQSNLYTAVLFYASWCPFSLKAYSKFEALSSMFPQIKHLSLKQSSAMPSVFSKFGIHSLPTVLVVNQTSSVRYSGPKDLVSLVDFYKRITGLEPVQYLDEEIRNSLDGEKSELVLKEVWEREPYLVLSILFLLLRVVVSISPRVLSRLKALWISYALHLNLGIFGGTSQIMGRVSHMIDVSGFWTKLKRSKSRNLRQGARNARVWASSLASVSLGES